MLILKVDSGAQSLFRTTLHADFSFGIYNWKSFAEFSDEYNKVNEAELENNLGKCRLWKGYKYGVSFSVGGLYTGLDVFRMTSSASATLKGDLRRYFDVRAGGFETQIGWNSKKEMIRPYLAVNFGALFSRVEGSLKYPDGDVSYGGESALNGAWHSVDFVSGLNGGVQIKILDGLMLHVSGQYRLMRNSGEFGANPFGRNYTSLFSGNSGPLKSNIGGTTISAGLGFMFNSN